MNRIIPAVLALTFLLAGCVGERGRGDAPVEEQLEEPRTVIAMPDRFPNLAVYCDGTTAIYVTTRADPGTVTVANSIHCQPDQ